MSNASSGSLQWIALTCPKVQDQVNEDQYQCSHRTQVFALSDGAMISYDSETWAKILVRRYAQDQRFSDKWLSDAIREFNLMYDRDLLPWMKQAALDRGTFASLVGLSYRSREHLARVFAVGDSIAVLCDGDKITSSFPYSNPQEFDQSPQLLSTQPAENGPVVSKDIERELTACWPLQAIEYPLIFLVTDALGRWLLEYRESDPNSVRTLRQIISNSGQKPTMRAFTQFVLAERSSGRLKRDDTSLIAVWGMNDIPTKH